jgi:hypothetical protein
VCAQVVSAHGCAAGLRPDGALAVAVRVAGLALNRDVPLEVPIAVSLHGHALRRLSIARLGVSVEFLMQKGQLLIELAPCLR